jgi:hypothetical protein
VTATSAATSGLVGRAMLFGVVRRPGGIRVVLAIGLLVGIAAACSSKEGTNSAPTSVVGS